MNTIKFNFFKVLLATLFIIPMLTQAAEISVPYPGSGNSSSGTVSLTQTNSPGSYNASVNWNLQQTGNLFIYTYNLHGGFIIRGNRTDPPITATIQNVALQTGAGVIASELLNANHSFGGPQTLTSTTLAGFANLPSSIFGIDYSVNGNDVTLSFQSYQAPIWGNIFFSGEVTGGVAVTCPPQGCTKDYAYAYNLNFNTPPTAGLSSYAGWVVVPGSITTPEPPTYLILAAALLAVIFFKRPQTVER